MIWEHVWRMKLHKLRSMNLQPDRQKRTQHLPRGHVSLHGETQGTERLQAGGKTSGIFLGKCQEGRIQSHVSWSHRIKNSTNAHKGVTIRPRGKVATCWNSVIGTLSLGFRHRKTSFSKKVSSSLRERKEANVTNTGFETLISKTVRGQTKNINGDCKRRVFFLREEPSRTHDSADHFTGVQRSTRTLRSTTFKEPCCK